MSACRSTPDRVAATRWQGACRPRSTRWQGGPLPRRLERVEPWPISPLTTGENDYLWLSWAPDGSRLAYSNAEPKEVHLIDVDRGVDTMIHGDTGRGLMFPRWSPDGSRLAVMTWLSEDPVKVQVGVLPVDDLSPHVTLTGPTFGSGIQHDWAPDGTVDPRDRMGNVAALAPRSAGGPGRRPRLVCQLPGLGGVAASGAVIVARPERFG